MRVIRAAKAGLVVFAGMTWFAVKAGWATFKAGCK